MPAHAHAGDGGSGRVELIDDRPSIERVQKAILALMDQYNYPEAARFAVRLALEEAIANAFKHGHKDLPKNLPITVEYRVQDEAVELAVQDQGPGFNPTDVPDPTLDENLECPSGRGLLLMRAYMGEVKVEGRGNRIVMRFKKSTT